MSEQLLMGWKVGSVFAMTGCTRNERLSISLIWEVFVFICIIEQYFFPSYNILCVTSRFFIFHFCCRDVNSVGAPLVQTTYSQFFYIRAILPPNIKVSLKYPGHVLGPQFELGTATHQHHGIVTYQEPGTEALRASLLGIYCLNLLFFIII